MNPDIKKRSGDEGYTSYNDAIEIIKKMELAGKKVFLPFTTSSQNIYRAAKKLCKKVYLMSDILKLNTKKYYHLDNNPFSKAKSYDFFNLNKKNFNYLNNNNIYIFDNPPFSIITRIITKLNQYNVKYCLFNQALTYFFLYNNEINKKTSTLTHKDVIFENGNKKLGIGIVLHYSYKISNQPIEKGCLGNANGETFEEFIFDRDYTGAELSSSKNRLNNKYVNMHNVIILYERFGCSIIDKNKQELAIKKETQQQSII